MFKLASLDTLKEIGQSGYAKEEELYSVEEHAKMNEACQSLTEKFVAALFSDNNELPFEELRMLATKPKLKFAL